MNINKKKLKVTAFTLAEILIAIAIVAALCLVLISVLLRIPPSTNKMMFKKSYYALNEAVNEVINSDADYPAEQILTFTDGDHQRGFNFTNATSNGSTNKFCYLLTHAFRTENAVCPSASTGATSGSFTTSDGISYQIYIPVADSFNISNITNLTTVANTSSYAFPINSDLYTTKILIDVNGIDKAPNCTLDTVGNTYGFNYSASCKDPDRFIIGVRYDGNLQAGCSTTPTCAAVTDQNAISILSNIKNYAKN